MRVFASGQADAVPLSDSAVVTHFERCGAVHVRGALAPPVAETIRDAARAVLHAWDRDAAAGALEPRLELPFERRFVPLAELRLPFDTDRAVLHPAVLALARRYLGKEPELEPNRHVREIVPGRGATHLPYHQDERIVRRAVLNVWIALDRCGREAPGLELVRGSGTALRQPSPPPNARFAVEHARLDEREVLRAHGEDALWRPEFEIGDAMLFAGTTIHRTYATPRMSSSRMSVELRLV
jgi:ectoine hydroxylase-related dioxygenase (phytanoyl-CoA dioxygenase family)